jgi:hypothetical protein
LVCAYEPASDKPAQAARTALCVFFATGFKFLAAELILGLHTNNQARIVWATPGCGGVFFISKGF